MSELRGPQFTPLGGHTPEMRWHGRGGRGVFDGVYTKPNLLYRYSYLLFDLLYRYSCTITLLLYRYICTGGLFPMVLSLSFKKNILLVLHGELAVLQGWWLSARCNGVIH